MVGYEEVIQWLGSIFTKIVIAVVILLIGFIVGKVLGRLIHKGLRELEIDKALKRSGVKFGIEDFISRVVEYFIYFLTVISALNQIGLTTVVLYMIAAIVLIILAASFILGIKDFIPNFISGMVIYRRDFIKNGSTIRVNGMEGEIVVLTLLETRIKTKKGDVICLPNSYITKSKVVVKKR